MLNRYVIINFEKVHIVIVWFVAFYMISMPNCLLLSVCQRQLVYIQSPLQTLLYGNRKATKMYNYNFKKKVSYQVYKDKTIVCPLCRWLIMNTDRESKDISCTCGPKYHFCIILFMNHFLHRHLCCTSIWFWYCMRNSYIRMWGVYLQIILI